MKNFEKRMEKITADREMADSIKLMLNKSAKIRYILDDNIRLSMKNPNDAANQVNLKHRN